MNSTIILYVEDEDVIRREMIEILSLDFENIYVAKNGKEGLEMYKKYNPDLVISDVKMPIMNGIEMTEKIMSINPDMKIILTTAFNEDAFIQKAKKIGIEHFINKPVNIDILFNSIEACIK